MNQHHDIDASNEEDLGAELKFCMDNYQYRDRLVVTEFGVSIAAFSLAMTVAVEQTGILRITAFVFVSLVLFIVATHIGAVNEDRRAAGRRIHEISESLGFRIIHQGHAGNRSQWREAPEMMVKFLWLITIVCMGSTVYVIAKYLS